MKMTNKFVINLFMINLETARKLKYVKKPYSWALYKTWKQIDEREKEE